MRLRLCTAGVLAGALAFSVAVTPAVLAQSSQVLLPEQSSAKAKEMLQQTIQALGGETYVNVRDTTCTGRFATFDRQDRKSTRLNSSHSRASRMPSSA